MANNNQADSVIPSKNSRIYYEAVAAVDKSVNDYFRYYEAPGVGHCWSGTGLYPASMFDSL
jgi:predicted peptidase